MLAGLRQHGNFPIPARADMNDVLAALARAAGWTVQPDGTTFRSSPQLLPAPPPQLVRAPPSELLTLQLGLCHSDACDFAPWLLGIVVFKCQF
jgi:hypothetical protein